MESKRVWIDFELWKAVKQENLAPYTQTISTDTDIVIGDLDEYGCRQGAASLATMTLRHHILTITFM